MLKHLSICAALVTFGVGSANAQQHEAVLRTVEVPGAAFDLVLATPKTPISIFDLAESPDALVVTLVGGELALGFEDAEQMLKVLDSLRSPVGVVHLRNNNGKLLPVAVYMVPKRALASAQ